MISSLLTAAAFLTRLPVARQLAAGAKEVGRAAGWFPMVGGLLGAAYAGGLWLLSRAFPPLVTAVLLTVLDALLTGALHWDGLADTADGFGGGATRGDVLRIMRDHAIGSYGAVALTLAVALKAAAISAMIGGALAYQAVAVMPVLGRWAAVQLSARVPYARPHADDAPSRFVGKREVILAGVVSIAIAVVVGRWRGVAALGLVALVTEGWGWYCRRRIGGITGDTLGAAVEISECLVLLLFLA